MVHYHQFYSTLYWMGLPNAMKWKNEKKEIKDMFKMTRNKIIIQSWYGHVCWNPKTLKVNVWNKCIKQGCWIEKVIYENCIYLPAQTKYKISKKHTILNSIKYLGKKLTKDLLGFFGQNCKSSLREF